MLCESDQMVHQKEMSPTRPPWQWLHRDGAFLLSFLLFLPLLLLATSIRRRSGGAPTGEGRRRRLPPSPPRLPLIGNLHQVGSCPHVSLAALSRKYGALMLLQLGQAPTVVVSSANMAEEIMKTHDVVFANRPRLEAAKQLIYGCKDLVFSPYGEYWKNLRRICSLHLLSTRRVQSYTLTRAEEVAFMIKKIEQSSSSIGVVDLREILQDFMTDFISRVIHGRCFRDEGLNQGFREHMAEQTPLLTRFHVGDYYPLLRWLSVLTGLDSRMRRASQKWEHILVGIIEEHLHRSEANGELHQETFVDALLALQKDPTVERSITTETIKALILDMFAAGTDTSYITLERAMAELIRNSHAMQRAQTEVRGIASGKPIVEETDTVRMSYLKAVIKETLRLHPPATLLLPRQSSEDTRIGGYDIPKQTRVIINAWAIMRDPEFWEAPDEFRPERFLGSNVDFRGSDFQFIPFGAGRRICPGMQFAVLAMELALANLLHGFDWELPNGMHGESLDMAENYGLTTRRKHSLRLVPIPTTVANIAAV